MPTTMACTKSYRKLVLVPWCIELQLPHFSCFADAPGTKRSILFKCCWMAHTHTHTHTHTHIHTYTHTHRHTHKHTHVDIREPVVTWTYKAGWAWNELTHQGGTICQILAFVKALRALCLLTHSATTKCPRTNNNLLWHPHPPCALQ